MRISFVPIPTNPVPSPLKSPIGVEPPKIVPVDPTNSLAPGVKLGTKDAGKLSTFDATCKNLTLFQLLDEAAVLWIPPTPVAPVANVYAPEA